MKKTILTLLTLLFSFNSIVIAQDKVVVVPLASGGKAGGTDKQVQYNDNGSLAGSEVYYDHATGNVGIGTSEPISSLEISGENSKVTYSSSAFSDNSTDFPIFAGRRARGSSITPLAVGQGDMLTYIGARGYDGVSWDFLSTGGISFYATENHDEFSKGTGISFSTTSNGTTNKSIRMVISAVGNVGIGTFQPQSKLAVSGLPTEPPDASGNAGGICVTVDGNLWVDNDGTIDCQ